MSGEATGARVAAARYAPEEDLISQRGGWEPSISSIYLSGPWIQILGWCSQLLRKQQFASTTKLRLTAHKVMLKKILKNK